MRQTAVINWLHDEIVTFLSNSSLVSLSSPGDHVDLVDERDDNPYPFVGIQKIGSNDNNAGIGNGQVFVDSLSYDSTDTLVSITYRRDVTFRVNVIPVTNNDAKLRDDLADDLDDHFARLARNGPLASDMDDLRVEEATPQGRPDEFVYGDGIPIEIDYSRYQTDNDPLVADTVNVDIDVRDADAVSGSL